MAAGLGLAFGTTTAAGELLSASVRPTPRPAGAPRHSDVCLSSRWRRPLDKTDTNDTFQAAAAFHVTRLDWVYATDTNWIADCRRQGYHFGGALNTILPDTPHTKDRKLGRILDASGKRLTAPWMTTWGGIWFGCANSPEYRATFLAHARLLIDGGADVLHMDDPAMNTQLLKEGACYCPACRQKAQQLGKPTSDIQADSVQEFFSWFRKEIDRYAGRHVPLSGNNFKGDWSRFPCSVFDYGIGELPDSGVDPTRLSANFAHARSLGKAQVLTLDEPKDVPRTRAAIATAYACGGHILVPWDLYVRDNAPRYFGRPSDFADLFAFVRASATLLDDYEAALSTKQEGSAGGRISIRNGSGYLHAFVRVKPKTAVAPVVVHLVEWAARPQTATLVLQTRAFLARGNLRGEWVMPAAYEQSAHEKAETAAAAMRKPGQLAGPDQAAAFAPLVVRQPAATRVDGDLTLVEVPALHPWGILTLTSSEHPP
jgi:hypothetical protein